MNSSDGFDQNAPKVPAILEMMDGKRLSVMVVMPRALVKMGEMLNRPNPFLEVETRNGDRLQIAKAALKTFKEIDLKKAQVAELKADKSAFFDPLKALGLQEGASEIDIRSAYLNLVRRYHPDRFAALNPPEEIETYLEAMLKRLNAAYEILCGEVPGQDGQSNRAA
jgi:DnaJ domain